MPYLIDGHNLIGQLPDVSLSDPDDEAKLVAKLASFGARTNKRITVIFDPAPNETAPRLSTRDQRGNVSVVWAHAGQTADDVLRERISAVRDRQGLIVVSGDAAVAGFARVSGVRVVSSRDFAKQLNAGASSGEAKPSAGKAEVQAWADVFKEPPAPPKPPPKPTPADIARAKRERRMEQLKRQASAKKKLF